MSGWGLVLVASTVCFALKVAGYLVPGRVVGSPAVTRAAALVTVALLTGLVAVQTAAAAGGGPGALVLDARAGGLLAAAGALALRAPYLVVVLLGAGTAAALRAAGAP